MVKKTGKWIEIISDKAVKLMLFGIAAVFAYWSGKYTCSYPADYAYEVSTLYPDSLGKNLLLAAGVILAAYLLQKLILRESEERQKKGIFCFSLAVMALVGVVLCIFVAGSRIPPYWDQMQVYLDALSFKAGDYSDMQGYLTLYPQQYGLIFIYELVFLIFPDSFLTLQYMNAAFVLVIIFFSYRVTEELFHNQTVNFYCILGTALFVPMYFYVNFVYGDVASIALSILGIWAVIRWCDKGGRRYIAGALISFVFACLFRKNVLIILIAVCLVLAVLAWKRASWKALVLGILVLVLPLVSMEGVKTSYELRSGNQVAEGVPAVLWVAMGMQYKWDGYGTFNGYTESTFRGEGGSDSEKAAQIGRTYIEQRLKEFKNDPAMAKEFYKAKLQHQWIEPTYSSMIMTTKYQEYTPTELVTEVYYGETAQRLAAFMNRYNFMIYLGVALYAFFGLFRRDGIHHSLMAVAIIGGFLFSILWEAKGRYVFPYVLLMVPYMAQGIRNFQSVLKNGVENGVAVIRRMWYNKKIK